MLYNLNDKVYYNGYKTYIEAIERVELIKMDNRTGNPYSEFKIYYHITGVILRLTANELTNE